MEKLEKQNFDLKEELKGEEEIPLEIKDYSSSTNEWENLVSVIESKLTHWNMASNKDLLLKSTK